MRRESYRSNRWVKSKFTNLMEEVEKISENLKKEAPVLENSINQLTKLV